jgi:hypothetical protein
MKKINMNILNGLNDMSYINEQFSRLEKIKAGIILIIIVLMLSFMLANYLDYLGNLYK